MSDMNHVAADDDGPASGHRAAMVEATWERARDIVLDRMKNRGMDTVWITPIFPTVTNFDPLAPPTMERHVCFRRTWRDGVQIIEGDGLMVERWR